ncbi:hypothetical protein PGT21_009456 [Puccinia graminis f. sp. tritici]|uniref:Uncharacterized protein n=1 Tax=Puccinia graminis f. sp. tritici TaxID=56615 RepID=A0A5B0NKR4_PUCGR|nr:hypothetical protein PGT21_009456 [Puccinia graminis f. sp. tritici]KAA1128798.1 hypothetical protein PGTUg99_021278 [Puccinia graminis f. sp. tritici]
MDGWLSIVKLPGSDCEKEGMFAEPEMQSLHIQPNNNSLTMSSRWTAKPKRVLNRKKPMPIEIAADPSVRRSESLRSRLIFHTADSRASSDSQALNSVLRLGPAESHQPPSRLLDGWVECLGEVVPKPIVSSNRPVRGANQTVHGKDKNP